MVCEFATVHNTQLYNKMPEIKASYKVIMLSKSYKI